MAQDVKARRSKKKPPAKAVDRLRRRIAATRKAIHQSRRSRAHRVAAANQGVVLGPLEAAYERVRALCTGPCGSDGMVLALRIEGPVGENDAVLLTVEDDDRDELVAVRGASVADCLTKLLPAALGEIERQAELARARLRVLDGNACLLERAVRGPQRGKPGRSKAVPSAAKERR